MMMVISVGAESDPDDPLSGFDWIMSKCQNLSHEKRLECESKQIVVAQLKIQAAGVRAQQIRANSEAERVRSEGKRVEIDNSLLQLHKAAENRSIQKEELGARSFDFPGIVVDPLDSKSLMVAFISLAAVMAVVILNCCKMHSTQPMLIVGSFVLILYTVLCVMIWNHPARWMLWLQAGAVLTVLSVVLPINFTNDHRATYFDVVKADSLISFVVGVLVIAESAIAFGWWFMFFLIVGCFIAWSIILVQTNFGECLVMFESKCPILICTLGKFQNFTSRHLGKLTSVTLCSGLMLAAAPFIWRY